jgi:chromosome segregation protein
MVRIRRIRFRGFKSFKHADAEFPAGFVAIAGPNGSGKSNVIDGIRFALGETALRSLRAKKVSELINQSSSTADVMLYLDGHEAGSKEKGLEIRRAIRMDGNDAKVMYKLDGHHATRTSIIEALRPLGLEPAAHNIIAQGQVQGLIDMNPKERREIIDSVAGISEYEAKKKEAIGELDSVQQRITEANLVLGEREAFLSQLEQEKDAANEYLMAQKDLQRSRATLVHMELTKLQKQHDDISKKYLEARGEIEKVESEIAKVDAQLSELEGKRGELTKQLGRGGRRETLLSQMEALKVSIAQAKTGSVEKKKGIEKLKERLNSFGKQQKELESKVASISKEAADAKKKAEEESKSAKSLEGQKGATHAENAAKGSLEKIAAEIESGKAALAKAEAEIARVTEAIRLRGEELSRLKSTQQRTLPTEDLRSQVESLQKDIAMLERESQKCFDEEKSLNRKLADVDRKSLELREKITVSRVNVSPQSANPALRAIEVLAAKNKGVFGTVSSLIKFDSHHAVAIEAAAGQRLSYVVVDSIDTAQECVEYLKREKIGRCTFIPLDKVSVTQGDISGAAHSPGCISLLLDCVEFDRRFYNAMQFVFGDTLLFDRMDSAKKFAGKARMVTPDGEVFERSGIITGGSMKAGIAARAALERLEAEFNSIKSERDSLYQQLYSVREDGAKARKEKAEYEVRARGIELEMENASAQSAKNMSELEALKTAQKELASSQSEHASLGTRKKELEASVAKLVSVRAELEKKLSHEAQARSAAQNELEEKIRAFLSNASSLLAMFDSKQNELRMCSEQLSALSQERHSVQSELDSSKKEILALEESAEADSKTHAALEAELKEFSAASEKLYKKLTELEAQIAEIAKSKGKLQLGKDQHNKALTESEVKKATVETRLIDLKAQSEQYNDVELLEAKREELEQKASGAEAKMGSLGAVNLKAPELYEEKKKDIEGVKGKVSQLATERAAVLSMIDEIETKKRSIFLDTFKVVNEHYRKLYSMIMRGEGFLLLDTPTDPFNSGLQMKVRVDGKDKYIDSMSGGEKSLLALMFIFAIQMFKPAPFYVLDEADAALDKENSKRLGSLLQQMSKRTQFIVVTHNDTILSAADVALGVTMTADGSKIVGVQLTQSAPIVAKVKAQPG